MAGTLFDSKVVKKNIGWKYKMVLDLYEQEVETVNKLFEETYREFKKIGLKVRFIDIFIPTIPAYKRS